MNPDWVDGHMKQATSGLLDAENILWLIIIPLFVMVAFTDALWQLADVSTLKSLVTKYLFVAVAIPFFVAAYAHVVSAGGVEGWIDLPDRMVRARFCLAFAISLVVAPVFVLFIA